MLIYIQGDLKKYLDRSRGKVFENLEIFLVEILTT